MDNIATRSPVHDRLKYLVHTLPTRSLSTNTHAAPAINSTRDIHRECVHKPTCSMPSASLRVESSSLCSFLALSPLTSASCPFAASRPAHAQSRESTTTILLRQVRSNPSARSAEWHNGVTERPHTPSRLVGNEAIHP